MQIKMRDRGNFTPDPSFLRLFSNQIGGSFYHEKFRAEVRLQPQPEACFPFSDSVKRAFASGVRYIAEPGGSIRDDLVIEECDRKDMVMAFTGMRLFHH